MEYQLQELSCCPDRWELIYYGLKVSFQPVPYEIKKNYIINKYNKQLFQKYYDSTSRLIMGCILATIVWILLTLSEILFPLSSSLFQALR